MRRNYLKSTTSEQKYVLFLPPGRIELTTPGLQDQCSATELRRHMFIKKARK
jgi:hypothetical protein